MKMKTSGFGLSDFSAVRNENLHPQCIYPNHTRLLLKIATFTQTRIESSVLILPSVKVSQEEPMRGHMTLLMQWILSG